jgi:hypothetical protein
MSRVSPFLSPLELLVPRGILGFLLLSDSPARSSWSLANSRAPYYGSQTLPGALSQPVWTTGLPGDSTVSSPQPSLDGGSSAPPSGPDFGQIVPPFYGTPAFNPG